jgi:hypothetical protein
VEYGYVSGVMVSRDDGQALTNCSLMVLSGDEDPISIRTDNGGRFCAWGGIVGNSIKFGGTDGFFYLTDKDIAANRESGLTQRIYDEIQTVFDNAAGMSGIKLGDVRFSSLETFEGKYGGNFHGFWLDH